MSEKFRILFRIARMIPRAPLSISTDRIAEILGQAGLDCEMRSLQRYLVELEGMGIGIECDESSKPYRWRFGKDADVLLVPGLDPQAALALRLVEMHMERVVPRATLRAIRPHLQAAKKSLEGKPVARWLDRVRLVPRSQPLEPPRVPGDVVSTVQQALLERKQMVAQYKNAAASDFTEMTLHPLGLVHRDSIACLIATAWHYTDPRIYPLHRMKDAKVLEADAREPEGFDMDAYLARGEVGFKVSAQEICVELLMEPVAARVVEETPLTPHQKMTPQADGRLLVEATVPHTHVLRSWILGFGASVEVRAPLELRSFVADAHQRAAARYLVVDHRARTEIVPSGEDAMSA